MALKKKRLIASFLVSILIFLLFALSTKLGSYHGRDNPISWSKLLKEIPFLLIISCLIGLAVYFFPKIFNPKFIDSTYVPGCMMCSKCEKSFNLGEIEDVFCDVCGTRLETLEGFYDRHPEFNEDSKTE